MEPVNALILAVAAFVGLHFVLSHPLRKPMVSRLGQRGFQMIYSLAALLTFAASVVAFRQVQSGSPLWDGSGLPMWAVATAVTWLGMVLLLGSFFGNPALPAPGATQTAQRTPAGVMRVTRHPMMWSFALFSLAHIMVSPTPRVLVFGIGLIVLALVGAHLQDGKKDAQMGGVWATWRSRTSYWPRLSALVQVGAVPLIGGTALWLMASYAHSPLIAVPAGIWRWL